MWRRKRQSNCLTSLHSGIAEHCYSVEEKRQRRTTDLEGHVWINFQVKSCLIPVLGLLRASPALQKERLCIPNVIFNKATAGCGPFWLYYTSFQATGFNLKSMARQKEIHCSSYFTYISIGKKIETGWAKRDRDDNSESNGCHALVKSSMLSHRPVPLLKEQTPFVLLKDKLKNSFVPVVIFPVSPVCSCLGCTQTFNRILL